MKKFIVLYHSPANERAANANATPEQQAQMMQAWFTWKNQNDESVVEMGAPLMASQGVDANGNWSQSTPGSIGGYSVVQASDKHAVQDIFKGHPHLASSSNAKIEILEFVKMG